MFTRSENKPKITDKKINNFNERMVNQRSIADISKETGQSKRQIAYDIADIQYYIQGSAEFQNAGDQIIKMIPKSLKNYHKLLDDCDYNASKDVMKWIGIHLERMKHSGNVNLNSMSNEELALSIVNAIKTVGKEPKDKDGGSND